MANPEKVRVHYDEDVEKTETQVRDELYTEISKIDGVLSVDVGQVIMGVPYSAIVEVEFDESETSSDTLVYEISTLPFVHNAQ